MATWNGRPVRFGPAIAGSLTGTVVFGVVMTMMGMMPMVAALIGSSSVTVGWLVHLAIGVVFGVVFAFWAAAVRLQPVASGLLYGVGVWVVGALVLMPVLLGMPGLVFDLSGTGPWMSLAGHLVYGGLTGLVYATLVQRAATGHARPTGT